MDRLIEAKAASPLRDPNERNRDPLGLPGLLIPLRLQLSLDALVAAVALVRELAATAHGDVSRSVVRRLSLHKSLSAAGTERRVRPVRGPPRRRCPTAQLAVESQFILLNLVDKRQTIHAELAKCTADLGVEDVPLPPIVRIELALPADCDRAWIDPVTEPLAERGEVDRGR